MGYVGRGLNTQQLTDNSGGTLPNFQDASGNYISLTPFIVGTDVHSGFSTIAAAITAAVSAGASATNPANIYIKPKNGGYTEDPVLQDGINLIGFGRSTLINGKVSMATAGTASLNDLTLQTNGDYFLNVSSANAIRLNVLNCFFNVTNHNGFTCSAANAVIHIELCSGNITALTFAYFLITDGLVFIDDSELENGATSLAVNSITGGHLEMTYTFIFNPVGTSGSSIAGLRFCHFESSSGVDSTLELTGSGTHDVKFCTVLTHGNVASIFITNTTIVEYVNVDSPAANAITGSGHMIYSFITLQTSTGHNVTTETALTTI